MAVENLLSVDVVEVKRFVFSDRMKMLLLQSVEEHNAHVRSDEKQDKGMF